MLAFTGGLALLSSGLASGRTVKPQGGNYADAAVANGTAALKFSVNSKGTRIAKGAALGPGFPCAAKTVKTTRKIPVKHGAFSFNGPVTKLNGKPAGSLVFKGTWDAPDHVGGTIKLGNGKCHSGRQAWAAALPAAVPQSLQASAVSTAEIDLSWSPAAHATGYEVGAADQSGGPYTQIGTTTDTALNETGLDPQTTRFYVVRATNDAGKSANSNEASATTVPLPPSPPTGPAASAVSATTIHLSWDSVSGASSYRVYRSTFSSGPYALIGNPEDTSFDDTGLAAGNTRFYVIRALGPGGESGNSAEVSATTFPAPPLGVSATATSTTTIRLAWTPVSSATSYRVLRSAATGGPYTEIGTPTAATFDDSSLSSNVTRFYVVQAVNSGGNSSDSAEVSTTTLLAAPSGVTAFATNDTTIHLNWTARSGATGYRVLRSSASGGPYTLIGSPTGTSFDDTTLSANTTRFYVIRATNAGGDSANSSQVSETTDPACADTGGDNTAANATFIGTVAGDSGTDSISLTNKSICQGDVDWYRVHISDASDSCFPGSDEPFSVQFSISLGTPIHGGGDLDLFAFFPNGTTQVDSSLNPGTTAESVVVSYAGTCGADDSADGFFKVDGFNNDANTYSIAVQGNSP